MAKLTQQQKLDALSYRFYQGGTWEPQAGDFYTTSRADLELYQVVSVEGGIVRTRFTEGSGAISEWPQDEFLTSGFGPKRVFVPPWVICAPAQQAQYTPGVRAFAAIDAERRRQTASEGWTPSHDDEHRDGSLAVAAACYALNTTDDSDGPEVRFIAADLWPWADEWWKPTSKKRDLEKAGALIAAEWERIDRLDSTPTEQHHLDSIKTAPTENRGDHA